MKRNKILFYIVLIALVSTAIFQYVKHKRINQMATMFESRVENSFSDKMQVFLAQTLHNTTNYFHEKHRDFEYLQKTFPGLKHDGNLTFSFVYTPDECHHLFYNEVFMSGLIESIPDWHEGKDIGYNTRQNVLKCILTRSPKWLSERKVVVELPDAHQPTDYKNAAGVYALMKQFDLMPAAFVSSDTKRYEQIDEIRERLESLAYSMYVRHMETTWGDSWADKEEHWGQYHSPPHMRFFDQLFYSSDGQSLRRLKNTPRQTPMELYKECEASRA